MTEAAACNIGPRQRRRRAIFGWIFLPIGVVGSILSESFLWQAIAFLGFLGYFQAQMGVCVALASQGVRNLDDGNEALPDADSVGYFQRQARSVYVRSFLATLVLVLISRREAIVNIFRGFLGDG